MTAVQVVASVGAALLSGWGYRLVVGLRPWAGAAWVAPLPLLVVAPRVSWSLAVGAAIVAWLLGQQVLWSYFTKVPVAQMALSSLGVASIVALTRTHMMAGNVVLAAVTPALAWAALEFLVALRSRHGAWWSLAYSQADHPTVLQVASLTGVWGVTALLLLPAGALAAVTAPGGSPAASLPVLGAGAVIAGFARWRMRRVAPPAETVHVGLVAQPGAPVRLDSPEGTARIAWYTQQVRLLAERGAAVIIWPELAFTVDPDQLQPFRQLAADAGTVLVVGLRVEDSNQAAVFEPDDAAPRWYQKHRGTRTGGCLPTRPRAPPRSGRDTALGCAHLQGP